MKPPPTIRDRVRDFRRVRAADLKPSPRNWRTHPPGQQAALRGLLHEVGFAGALLARELPDGTLELVDGHLRAETTPEMEVPVLVLDVTEAEALRILATHDPLAALAGADADRLEALLGELHTDQPAVAALFATLAGQHGIASPNDPPADWPELADGSERTITLRFRDEDEPAIRAFVGQRDDRPLDPRSTGARILKRIRETKG